MSTWCRGWAERVCNTTQVGASGSGCSAYVAKPSWQHDPRCTGRTVADLSAVASNLAVYEKAPGGWLLVGGTSASAPLIAGVYALAGNASKITPGYTHRHARSLFDITKRTNVFGNGCGGDYLCEATTPPPGWSPRRHRRLLEPESSAIAITAGIAAARPPWPAPLGSSATVSGSAQTITASMRGQGPTHESRGSPRFSWPHPGGLLPNAWLYLLRDKQWLDYRAIGEYAQAELETVYARSTGGIWQLG